MVALNTSLLPPTANTARLALSRAAALLDADLVHRFNAGDETAFVEIVNRYKVKMQQIAMRLLHNQADAEEISQDTFIRAHCGLGRFRGDSSLASWLYRITVNLSHNRYWYYFRRRRHASLPLDAVFSESNTATFSDIIASDAPSPSSEIATSEFATIVAKCMKQLPTNQREILTLRNVQQYSYAKISRLLGIRIGTAKSRIARARANLRLLLAESYPESFGDALPSMCFERTPSAGILRMACA